MYHFSLTNIKDLFSLFVQNHYQLKRFGFGTIPDVESLISAEQTFPVLYANLNDVQYPTDNLKVFSFNILIFDLLNNDKSNEQDVWSDSIQIGEDFIKFLKYNSTGYYEVINQPRIETFTERFTDYVAGCNLNLSLRVYSSLQNDCGVPMNGFEFNIPSFLASGGTGSGSNFSCSDLLGCDLFNTLSGQSQSNYDNILILSGNQSSFVLSSLFNLYTGTTESQLSSLQSEINQLSAATSAYTLTSTFNYYTGLTQSQLNTKANLSGASFTGSVHIPILSANTIYDSTNNSGSTGQVLTDTPTGIQWQTPAPPPSPVGANLYLFYNY